MLLLTHGFTGELLVELVNAGLATVTVDVEGERAVHATWLQITDAGRPGARPAAPQS
jgi:hypothetical protein